VSLSQNQPILRVTVHKGATIATGDYSNLRVDYTVEADVPSGMTAGDAIADIEAMCDERLLKAREAAHDAVIPEEVESAKLPWKKYEDGVGEWVPAEAKGAEGLPGRLRSSKGVWQGKEYLYKLSKSQSTGRLFIQRFPRRGSVV